MLKILEASDEKPNGKIQLSSRSDDNDISKKPVKRAKLIDYIIINPNQSETKVISREIMRYQKLLKSGKKDLSDHLAVKAVVRL